MKTINEVFLHTVCQGLGSKHSELRRELKQLISAGDVTDDMLLRQLVKVTSEEEERQRRLQSTPRLKTTHAHSAQIEGISEIKTAAATTEQTDKEIRKFITQVEALTDVVNSLKQPKGKEQNCQCMSKAPEKRRRSGCPNCIRQRKEETCSHCFICGGEDHRAVGCLNRQKSLFWPDLTSGQKVHQRQQSLMQVYPIVTIQAMLVRGIAWVVPPGNQGEDSLKVQEKRLSSLLGKSVYWKEKLEVIV